MTQPGRWLGVVFDTNSHGRFNLLVGESVVVGVRGNYWRAARQAAGGVALGAGAAMVQRSVTPRAERFMTQFAHQTPHDIAALSPDGFAVHEAEVSEVRLRKRWFEHSLTFHLARGEERKFTWKPQFNEFRDVVHMLEIAFSATDVATSG